MQPTLNELQEPNETKFTHKLGRVVGRLIATFGAAVLTRIFTNKYFAENEEDNIPEAEVVAPTPGQQLLRNLAADASIATVSIVAWNTELGATTGANLTELVVDKAKKCYAAGAASISEGVANSVGTHLIFRTVDSALKRVSTEVGNYAKNRTSRAAPAADPIIHIAEPQTRPAP